MEDSIINALSKLPASDQELVANLVRGMAERAGIHISDVAMTEVKPAIEYLERWLTKLRSERFSERTISSYQYAIERFLQGDPVPTRESIRSYLAKRLADGVSANHVNLERKAFKSYFDAICEAGVWPVNPMTGIKAFRVPRRQPELPDEEGIRKLLGATFYRKEDEARFRLLITLLVDSGMRISEACGIKKADINMDRPSIKIIGKGDKEREVPISPISAGMIAEYLERYDEADSPFLLPSRGEKGACWHHTSVEHVMRRVCDRLKIKRINPHSLRHYAATQMLKDGAKLEIVSRILGHAGVGITADLYRHVASDEMDEEHRKHGALNGLNGTNE